MVVRSDAAVLCRSISAAANQWLEDQGGFPLFTLEGMAAQPALVPHAVELCAWFAAAHGGTLLPVLPRAQGPAGEPLVPAQGTSQSRRTTRRRRGTCR